MNDSSRTRTQNLEGRNRGILIGYHFQNDSNIELGIGLVQLGVGEFHPFFKTTSFSIELTLENDFIFAPQLSFWSHKRLSSMTKGINFAFYSKFEDASFSFVVRPEIGIMKSYFFRLVYGYNFKVTNREFEGINTHDLSIRFFLLIKE